MAVQKQNQIHGILNNIADTFTKLTKDDLLSPGQRSIIAGSYYSAVSDAMSSVDHTETPVEEIWCGGNIDIIGFYIASATPDTIKALNTIGLIWIKASDMNLSEPENKEKWIAYLTDNMQKVYDTHNVDMATSEETASMSDQNDNTAQAKSGDKEQKPESEKQWWKNPYVIGATAVAAVAAVGYGVYHAVAGSNDDIFIA